MPDRLADDDVPPGVEARESRLAEVLEGETERIHSASIHTWSVSPEPWGLHVDDFTGDVGILPAGRFAWSLGTRSHLRRISINRNCESDWAPVKSPAPRCMPLGYRCHVNLLKLYGDRCVKTTGESAHIHADDYARLALNIYVASATIETHFSNTNYI